MSDPFETVHRTSDRFETVHRTSDRLEAEMVAEVLVKEGIDARLIGTTSAALIGVAPHILKLRIEVPGEAAAQAREIIADLQGAEAAGPEAAAAAEAESEAAPAEAGAATTTPAPAAAPPDADADGAAPRPRRPLLAAGAAFVLPGGCHIYARHPWTGLVLAAGYLAALVVLIAARRYAVATSGALTLAALLLADLVAGQLAVRRANHGVAAPHARQLGRGLVLVALAAVLGSLLGHLVPPPKPKPPLRYGLPLEYGPRHAPADLPLDLPLYPQSFDELLRRHGAASQPASRPILVWPTPMPERPSGPQIPR